MLTFAFVVSLELGLVERYDKCASDLSVFCRNWFWSRIMISVFQISVCFVGFH